MLAMQAVVACRCNLSFPWLWVRLGARAKLMNASMHAFVCVCVCVRTRARLQLGGHQVDRNNRVGASSERPRCSLLSDTPVRASLLNACSLPLSFLRAPCLLSSFSSFMLLIASSHARCPFRVFEFGPEEMSW